MPLLLARSPVGAGDDGRESSMTEDDFDIPERKWFVIPSNSRGLICQELNIMVILDKPITREELVRLAENFYGDMIKGAGMWRMRRLEKE